LQINGELPRPLPSPAEKGDREAVDEESICNPTYWDYSYVPTTIWIDASKWLIQMHFLGFRDPKNGRIVGRSPGTLAYKCSPHPPLRGPPSPLGKANQGRCQPTYKPKFEGQLNSYIHIYNIESKSRRGEPCSPGGVQRTPLRVYGCFKVFADNEYEPVFPT
jgi:hypothetical protein